MWTTWKNYPKKTYERHSNMNPKNLTASFAGITAQSWRKPLGTIHPNVTVQDETGHWFLHPSFKEGVSRQIPDQAAATRSEPHRPMLWGLSCCIHAVWCPQMTTSLLNSFCWHPLCVGQGVPLDSITSDPGASAYLFMGPQWWGRVHMTPAPRCCCSPVCGSSVMEGLVASTTGLHCE